MTELAPPFADASFVYFAASITDFPNDGIIVGAVDLNMTPQSIATSNVFPLSGPLVIAAVPEPARFPCWGSVSWVCF